jgi:hypothetical protein
MSLQGIAYPRDYFKYNPETGDLRWARVPTNSVKRGDPVGGINADGVLQCHMYGATLWPGCVAWWAHRGQWRTDITPRDGDCFNLKLDNLARGARATPPERPKPYPGADRIIEKGGVVYLGKHRLSRARALVLMKLATARVYDTRVNAYIRRPVSTHELTEILWGDDEDGGPLNASNVIAVHVCKLNQMLVSYGIKRYADHQYIFCDREN